MMHEDIIKRMTIERGRVGEAKMRRDLRIAQWSDRICIGAAGLGVALIVTIILRWIIQ